MSPLRPPCGGDAEGRGGAPHLKAYLVAGGGPPLCHSVTSPPARGGEGNHEFFKGLLAGGDAVGRAGLPISRPIWTAEAASYGVR